MANTNTNTLIPQQQHQQHHQQRHQRQQYSPHDHRHGGSLLTIDDWSIVMVTLYVPYSFIHSFIHIHNNRRRHLATFHSYFDRSIQRFDPINTGGWWVISPREKIVGTRHISCPLDCTVGVTAYGGCVCVCVCAALDFWIGPCV